VADDVGRAISDVAVGTLGARLRSHRG
jgi:hypothetical protein